VSNTAGMMKAQQLRTLRSGLLYALRTTIDGGKSCEKTPTEFYVLTARAPESRKSHRWAPLETLSVRRPQRLGTPARLAVLLVEDSLSGSSK